MGATQAAAVGTTEVAASLYHCLQVARTECKQPDVQVQTVLVLLAIARRGGECTMQDVESDLGMSQATVSRQVAKLGAGGFRDPGLGFLEAYEDPQWRRRKLVRMTARGARLWPRCLGRASSGSTLPWPGSGEVGCVRGAAGLGAPQTVEEVLMALQNRNGVWYADFRATGGPRVSLKTRDERVAREKHAEMELAHLRGQDIRQGGGGGVLTLDHAIDRALQGEWRDYRRKDELRANLDEVVAEFGRGTPLNRIDTPRLSGWVVKLRQRGLSGGTINRKLAVVSRLMHLGKVWGSVSVLPYIPRQKESQGNIRWYSRDEEKRVLLWCAYNGPEGEVLGRLVVFLADTGWRLNEALGLEWGRVALQGGGGAVRLDVEDQKGKRQTSTPLTPRAASTLRTLQTISPLRPFPFEDHWIERLWARCRRDLGLGDDATLHAWRHTAATRLVEAGVDVRTVMEYMRHRDIRTTMRYVHLVGASLGRAVAALAQSETHSHAPADSATVVPFRRAG